MLSDSTTWTAIVCETCGISFPKLISQIKKGRKFCSKLCHYNYVRPIKDRFFEKVKKGESCWTWIAHKCPYGYGRMYDWRDGIRKIFFAHRISWEIHFGAIPQGLKVLHKCDNPPCVNPDHLFLGTNKDNYDDMVSKGRDRHAKGTDHPHAKLTDDCVREIREKLESRLVTQKSLAEEYGVARGIISLIYKNKAWKHVE